MHLAGWLKFKKWIIPGVGKDVKQLEASFTAGSECKMV
jgi:hypothetical protein